MECGVPVHLVSSASLLLSAVPVCLANPSSVPVGVETCKKIVLELQPRRSALSSMEEDTDNPVEGAPESTGDPPGRAIQFVSVQANGKLHITDEGAAFLSSVHFPSKIPPGIRERSLSADGEGLAREPGYPRAVISSQGCSKLAWLSQDR